MNKVDPRKVFYIWSDLDADDGVDIETSVPTPGTKEEVMEEVRALLDEHGGQYYVVECRCIQLVKRGTMKVIPIKAKP